MIIESFLSLIFGTCNSLTKSAINKNFYYLDVIQVSLFANLVASKIKMC